MKRSTVQSPVFYVKERLAHIKILPDTKLNLLSSKRSVGCPLPQILLNRFLIAEI